MSGRSIPRQSPNTSSVQSAGQSLFNQLLELSERLLEVDPELYKTALARMRENCPREPSPVKRAAGAEGKGVKGEHNRRSGNVFHKYTLPGDAGKREYYQCMVCEERRVTNSFMADHQHEGQKSQIRWYCPLCDTLFAVTHRGYHIKNRHKNANASDVVKKEEKTEFESMIKSGSSDDGEEEDEGRASVPRKRGRPSQPRDDDETSQGSEDASHDLVGLSRASSTISPPAPPPPAPLVPTTSQVLDMGAQFFATESAPIVHTVTQEALGGSLMSMDVSTTPRQPTDSSKLFFSSSSATLTRA